MKRFILKISAFLILFAFVDFSIGKVLRCAESHARGGKSERNYYINHKTNEDILFFGSSRALNHYNPRVFEQTLGMTAYNCGEDETGIICFYPKLNLIKKRYKPKVIVYDVYLSDLLGDLRLQNIDYLKTLKTSYGIEESVDTMFWRYEPMSKYKMMSSLYRYNSSYLNILIDNIKGSRLFEKGFYLLNTDSMKVFPKVDNSHKSYSYDRDKLRFLEKFIEENKRDNIVMFFAISPELGRTNDELFEPIKKICYEYNVPLFNHYCDTVFNKHMEYFGNQNHLNQKGALKYSNIISNEIDRYLSDDKIKISK